MSGKKTSTKKTEDLEEVIDTDIPDDSVNEEVWRQMQHEAWAAMEGLSEEDVL